LSVYLVGINYSILLWDSVLLLATTLKFCKIADDSLEELGKLCSYCCDPPPQ